MMVAALQRAPTWLWDVLAYAPAAALVPAVGVGTAGLLGRGPRILREHRALSALLAAGATAGLAYWQLGRFFTEQPHYDVESVLDGFEVRRYPARIVAETTVDERDWERSLNEGFRRLAGYIYGANAGQRKIAMTAPVNVSSSQRVAMTSPVTARAEGAGLTVTFTMPRTHALTELPRPTDERVRLREQEGARVAVLQYRGSYGGEKTRAMGVELLRRVTAAGLRAAGEPAFAGYDAPSTLPFLRRLEVWVPLA